MDILYNSLNQMSLGYWINGKDAFCYILSTQQSFIQSFTFSLLQNPLSQRKLLENIMAIVTNINHWHLPLSHHQNPLFLYSRKKKKKNEFFFFFSHQNNQQKRNKCIISIYEMVVLVLLKLDFVEKE